MKSFQQINTEIKFNLSVQIANIYFSLLKRFFTIFNFKWCGDIFLEKKNPSTPQKTKTERHIDYYNTIYTGKIINPKLTKEWRSFFEFPILRIEIIPSFKKKGKSMMVK